MPTREIAQNVQIIEVGVTGPEDANRMFITTGYINPNYSVLEDTGFAIGSKEETYTTLLYPRFEGGQFRRAIASAAVRSKNSIHLKNLPTQSQVGWAVRQVEADYDDEENRVELRLTIQVQACGASINVESVTFQVTTLARID